MPNLKTKIYKLIVRASTRMPDDVVHALESALKTEESAGNTSAADRIKLMLENICLAEQNQLPLCQDTGLINFYIDAPPCTDRKAFESAAESAVAEATGKGLLRSNSVCPLTGKNTGNNLGAGTPGFYWRETKEKFRVRLLLKGGGSENVCTQYALPDSTLNAERNLEGVEKCVLNAVEKAGGKGCPPSVISVCIGGDRAAGYAAAKEALFRKIGERSGTPDLAELEQNLRKKVNSLDIGPMGLGGKTTALDVFITALNRHPASFFVTVSFMCWSCRRAEMEI